MKGVVEKAVLGGYCFPKEFMCLNNPELLSVPFFPSDIGNQVLNAVNVSNSTGSGGGSNIFANNNSNNNNTNNIFARNNSNTGNAGSSNIFSNNNATGSGYASGGTNIFNNGNNNMGSSNIFNNNNSAGNSIFNRPQQQVGGGNIFSNNNNSGYGSQQGGSIFSNQNGNSNNIFRGNNSSGSIFNNGNNNSNPNIFNQAPTYGPSNQNIGGQYNNGQYGAPGYMNSAYPGMHPQYYGGGMIPPYMNNPYIIPGAPAVIYVPIKERRDDDSMSELYVDGKFVSDDRDSYHRNLDSNRGSRLRNSLLAKDLAQGLPVSGLSNSRTLRSRSLYELQ